jgi:hypothetical protein
MLIWLGKQLLGQADKIQQEVTGSEGGPIKITLEELLRRRDNIVEAAKQ